MSHRYLHSLLAAVAIIAMVCVPANADPLPGEVLKFQQLPLNNGLPPGNPNTYANYPGHDEWSTARSTLPPANFDFAGTFMADDFADKFSTPVVHVRWWGSYENNINQGLAQRFLISFESDLPNDPLIGASRPDQPLLNQIVKEGPLAPGSGTFTEKLVNPAVNEHLWEYNAELALPFQQKPDTVYWLKIVALNDPNVDNGAFNWGWHNRDWGTPNPLASTAPNVAPGEGIIGSVINPNGTSDPVWHFQDDAVSGLVFVNANATGVQIQQTGYKPENYIAIAGAPPIDGPPGIENFSKDLAFELYTVPEPATVLLFGAGAAGLGLAAWKRRRPRLSA
ncbi:MAG: PEP-CTERM sorting domain-containing protein [Pirellulales bacterium]|nr:PEP-CTERM sorting domain-containing protein [Pirellulales bacterium]